jgi:hypothetical protein
MSVATEMPILLHCWRGRGVHSTPGCACYRDVISSRQFFLQLTVASLTSQVEAWVAQQDTLVQIAFNKSATFRRDHEMLQQGFAGLGFTVEQVDQSFTSAAGL